MKMSISLLANLKNSIITFNSDETLKWTKQIIEEKVDLIEAMNAITEAMRTVGEGYTAGIYFLPELIGAASAVQQAIPLIEEEIQKAGASRETRGKVVIGTVAGDIHTIGKGMVSALFIAGGFYVHDLGTDVSTDRFVQAVREEKPDILAMSALLSSTAPETEKVIKVLQETGLRNEVKVIIGGGAITEDYATAIKADGFSATAPGAVKLVEHMLAL
jgi:methanogenic corrinoid protein MtbC1